MNPQDDNQNAAQTSAYDPFPEPQTIPAGWDTSGFFSASQDAPEEQANTSSENALE
jgi:hypothetical protein